MKKKVTITSLHLKHGGVEMAISLMANALCELDYEVEILCTYCLCEPVYPLDERVKVTYLTDVRPNREEFAQAVRNKKLGAIVREGFAAQKVLRLKKKTMKDALASISEGTVVCTRNEHAVLLSRYGQKGVRKIFQLHHDHAFDQKLIKDFQKNYQNIDCFVSLTDQTCKEIEGFLQGHNSKTVCVTIPNFLEKPFGKPIPVKKKQAIAVGRLHEVKGFDRMLAIWSRVAARHPGWILKMVGDGTEKEKLFEMAQQLNIEGSVVFTGALPHEQVLDEMAKSAFYLMTSQTEAFPFVLLESDACATPAIAYDVRVGPRAVITDKLDGFLVEDGQADQFAGRIEELMADPEKCARMGQAARQRAGEFMKEPVMKRWQEIL